MGIWGSAPYNALDGEMIVIDGAFWRARHDGSLEAVPPETETPFAAVTYFEVNDEFALPEGLDMASLGAILSVRVGASNAPVWHLHGVSKARDFGGHILELETAMGVVSLDRSPNLTVLLPTSSAFNALDLPVP